MLAVSVQPTPLRWILKVVPARPRATSSGSADGAIQCVPDFLPAPVATQRPCSPPRSSGVLKRNSRRPLASAVLVATTLEDSSHPPPPAATRLPVTVLQLSS